MSGALCAGEWREEEEEVGRGEGHSDDDDVEEYELSDDEEGERERRESLVQEEVNSMDSEVIQDLFVRVCAMEEKIHHYIDLCGFLLLLALFCVILCLQADPTTSYAITSSHNKLLPPGFALASSYRFSGPSDFYQWLNDSVLQVVAAGPVCGDGSCDAPFEYPGFGRFGCSLDCGAFTYVTPVAVTFATNFPSKAVMAVASWNLCMTSPVVLCWYSRPQSFSQQTADFTVSLSIPDGDWVLVLNAPAGGVRGSMVTWQQSSSGTAAEVAGGAGLAAGSLISFGECAREESRVDCAATCSSILSCFSSVCEGHLPTRLLSSSFSACKAACQRGTGGMAEGVKGTTCWEVVKAHNTSFPELDCPVLRGLHRLSRKERKALMTDTAAAGAEAEVAVWGGGGGGKVSAHHEGGSGARGILQILERGYDPSTRHDPLLLGGQYDRGVRVSGGRHAGRGGSQRRRRLSEVQAVDAAAAATVTAAAAAAAATAKVPMAEETVGSGAIEYLGRALASSDPLAANDTLWTHLGSTDDQRMTVLQVAVGRTVYTMVKDTCLAGRSAKSLSMETRNRLVAFLCTFLGGPALTDKRCNFSDPSTGKQLLTLEELYTHMHLIHHTTHLSISLAQQRRFLEMLVAAVQSVLPLSSDTVERLASTLHALDTAITRPNLPGCSKDGAWLQWHHGSQLNSTITAGGRVTWVWGEDEPLSIKVSGSSDSSTFQGFGSNHLAVSRLMACSPANVGIRDAVDEPFPCVLRLASDPPEMQGAFTYSALFTRPLTVRYASATRPSHTTSPATTPAVYASGVITVLPGPANTTAGLPVSASCSPTCPFTSLSNGVCESECNTPDCNFDGGDCTCVDPIMGPGVCPCEGGMLRADDGTCCAPTAVGRGLSFPFSLRRHGTDPAASNSPLLTAEDEPHAKWVGHNKVLIGLFLIQSRANVTSCNCSSLAQLSGWCTRQPTSLSPFGLNPHFLPSSPLFDPSAANLSVLQDSTADPMQGSSSSARGSGSIPFGFFPPQSSGFNGYPLVFDINLHYEDAMNRLQYLIDGHYIDNATDSIDVQLLTFNAEAQKITVFTVHVDVDQGGAMLATYEASIIPTQMYGSSGANLIVIIVLQVLFLLGILWNIGEEVREMVQCKRVSGTVLSYFDHAWNWVDIASLSLQLTGIALWIGLCVIVSNFTMEPRYNIYFSLSETPLYWAVPKPPEGFAAAAQVYSSVATIVHLQDIYFTVQGINLFLMLMRALKLMDFQPYLGFVTRSLSMAALSLVHFFILAFLIFFVFSIFAFAVFGNVVPQFSTLGQSMITCFMVLLNDNAAFYSILYLKGWINMAALIFWFLYIILMVFILFNFLIAIIVDAFMDVHDVSGNQTTMFRDILDMWTYAQWRIRGRVSSFEKMADSLVQLGATDFRSAEEEVILSRYRSVTRKLHNLMLPLWGGKRKPRRLATVERFRRKQRVIKVKGLPIDEVSLGIILERKAEMAQDEFLLPAFTPKKGSGESADGKLKDSDRVGSHSSFRTLLGFDPDSLCKQVLAQFGENVVKQAVPGGDKRRTKKKRDTELIKEELVSAMKELKAMRKTTDDMNQVILQLAQAQVRQLQMMENLTGQMAKLHSEKSGVQS